MTKDEKLLVKVYEKTKDDLRLLAKHEKAINGFLGTKEETDIILKDMGYTQFNDQKKLEDEFYTLTGNIINRIKQTITSLIPSNYKAKYCTAVNHFDGPVADYYAGEGYCHSSFINDKDEKYCVSPYGYVYFGITMFGRILKDGTIKKGKVGRFGHFQYD